MKRFLTSLAAAALVAFALPAPAQQIGNYTNLITVGATTNIIAAQTASNLTSQLFNIRPGEGIGVQLSLTNASAGTENAVFYFDATLDGSNWVTNWWSLTVAQSGTDVVRAITNIPPDWVDSFKYVRVGSITNAATNTLGVQHLILSRGVPPR